MRPSSHLLKMQSDFQRKSLKLRNEVKLAQQKPFQEKDRALGYAILQFHNLWGAYCRSVALSAFYNSKSSSGVRTFCIPPAGAPYANSDIEHFIYSFSVHCKPWLENKYNTPPLPSREEPAWHNLDILYKGLSYFSYSNLSAIDAARSFSNSIVLQLTSARNFYAHKKKNTNEKVVKIIQQEYSMPAAPGDHVSDLLYQRAYNGAGPLVLDWMDTIRNGSSLMI